MPPAKSKKQNKVKPVSLGLYKKIAISFVILTLILVAVVFYFSTTKARVIIVPGSQEVRADLIVEVLDKDGFGLDEEKEAAIKGVFLEHEVDAELTMESSGQKTISTELTGKATIVNNSSKNQALVATTRLLNEDRVLFRMKDRAYIPAGSSLEVDIYADDPTSIEGEIAPGHWTIPGLWEGLQKVIYAETKEVLFGGDKVVSYVQVGDLSRAEADVKDLLVEQARESINDELEEMQLTNNLDSLAFQVLDEEVSSYECDAKADDEVKEFSCRAEGKIKAAVFQKSDLENMIKDRLSKEITSGLKLLSFNKDNYSLNIDHYDDAIGDSVSFKVAALGIATITASSDMVDIEKISGLNKDEAIYRLEQEKFIKEANVVISPFWLNKVPKAKDRVSIEIVQ